MPEQDSHAVTTSPARRERLDRPTTTSGVTDVQAGVARDRADRARLAAHGASLVAEQDLGTPYGAQRAAGTTGANSETTGVPTAAARWAGPVLPTTTAAAAPSTPAQLGEVGRPPRSSAGARPRRRRGGSPRPPATR